MMWGNYGGMMGGGFVWGSVFGIVALVDLVLLGMWLWKQINEK